MTGDTAGEVTDTYYSVVNKKERCDKTTLSSEIAGSNSEYVNCHLYEPLGG